MSALPDALPRAEAAPADLSAQERLARSRANMNRWLADDDAARADTSGSGAGLSGWLQKLRGQPLAALAIDALTDRWSRHPLHTTVRVAEAAARETIAPLVRRHPAAVLGASAVAGALLVRAKPWRWLARPALLTGLVAQIAALLVARLTAPPRQEQAPPKVRQQTDKHCPPS